MNTTKKLLTALLAMLLLLASLSAAAWKPDAVIYANADPDKYIVEVDVNNCVTTVYQKGEDGEYDDIVRQMICTPGARSTPTPTGSFTFNERRRRFGYFSKYNCYAQYWIQVNGGIYFHSILYTRPVEGKFTRSSYNQLGGPGSHGCVRMLVEDVRWLYYNIPAGTKGRIVSNDDDDELHDSLMPKKTARNYMPGKDLYELAKRGYPKAALKKNAQIELNGGQKKTLAKSSVVSVLSSGSANCKVTVEGKTGYIATKALQFYPNGYDDSSIIYRANRACNVYTEDSVTSSLLEVLQSGEELEVTGKKGNYYTVDLDGDEGFVLASRVDMLRKTITERAIWVNEKDAKDVVPEDDAGGLPTDDSDVPDEPVN